MIEILNVSGGYEQADVIQNISFQVNRGEIFGIIGPNGSGKTTLLKMIAGHIPIEEGQIKIKNQPIQSYKIKDLAKTMAVLPQLYETHFSYTVFETVMLGRYAHQKGIFSNDFSDKDQFVVDEAIKLTNISHMVDKTIDSLSGGERQRVFLARALAQEPEVILLDEPTNHLDIHHQMRLFDSLQNWVRDKGLTVIAIFHDLNIASLYCDRLLLLNEGKIVEVDEPVNILQTELLSTVYQTPLIRGQNPKIPSPFITVSPDPKVEKSQLFSRLEMDQSEESIVVQAIEPFKTLSSAVINAGFSWSKYFINRYVDKSYNCNDPITDLKNYIIDQGLNPLYTVGMMTAASLKDVVMKSIRADDYSIAVIVTAGLSNAVDVSKAYLRTDWPPRPSTINTWVFIDGILSEAAFVQAMMTTTEAKVKAVIENKVVDPVTNTLATGTSTDSVLIASSQYGALFEYAGTITPLGKTIGQLVFEATNEAIIKNKQRMEIKQS